jgi:SAM-dependent methyltransferase
MSDVVVKESQKLYDSLTSQFTISMAKAASKRERDEKQLKSMNLVYGEITFESMGIILEKIKKRYGKPYVGTSGSAGVLQQSCSGIFYDLGSGSGKSTIAAAVLHNFEMCWGIEQLEGLYSMSLDLNNAYEQKGKSKLLGREKDTDIQFLNADFLNLAFKDWRDADVIFCNSTCFDEQLMNKFCDRASKLFVTLFRLMKSANMHAHLLHCML